MPTNGKSGLNPRQIRVLELYLADEKKDGGTCYKTVYTTCKSDGAARANFHRLYNTPAARAFVDAKNAALADKLEITQAKILTELANIGFVDPVDIFNKDGSAKALHAIPEHARRAICGVKVTRQGKRTIWEYRFVSKSDALRMLGLNQRMFTPLAEGKTTGTHEEQLRELE